MNITQKNIDKIYALCENLINSSRDLYKSVGDFQCCEQNQKSISDASNYIVSKLKPQQKLSKRRKCVTSNEFYVPPRDVPIGLKWKSQTKPGNEIVNHKLVQATFQYVSIVETLKATFKNTDFKKMYIEYNENLKHTCVDSMFQDFCCGANYKKHDIFHSKCTLQIQLGIDDFEPCNALKSKAGIHKMCGVYLQLRNIPEYYRSKLKKHLFSCSG